MVIDPVRAAPLFAATEIVTEPLPVPEAPPVMLTNEALVLADQLQLVPCTLTTLNE